MSSYPVHFGAARPLRFRRVELLVRVVALLVIGMVGLSLGTIFAFAFVALPIYAAVRLSSLGSPEEYLRRDGPRLIRILHWFGALSSWLALVTERLPAHAPSETVAFEIEDTSPRTTPGLALSRIVTGLPSAVVLMVLCWVGVLIWLLAALSVLFTERVGSGLFGYLAGLQRWSVRLLAYQACLVDAYPPFSFTDTAPMFPHAKATV
jgi:hypothetical protein